MASDGDDGEEIREDRTRAREPRHGLATAKDYPRWKEGTHRRAVNRGGTRMNTDPIHGTESFPNPDESVSIRG